MAVRSPPRSGQRRRSLALVSAAAPFGLTSGATIPCDCRFCSIRAPWHLMYWQATSSLPQTDGRGRVGRFDGQRPIPGAAKHCLLGATR